MYYRFIIIKSMAHWFNIVSTCIFNITITNILENKLYLYKSNIQFFDNIYREFFRNTLLVNCMKNNLYVYIDIYIYIYIYLCICVSITMSIDIPQTLHIQVS